MAVKYRRPSLREAMLPNDPLASLDQPPMPRDPAPVAQPRPIDPKIVELQGSAPWLTGGPGSYENSSSADASPGGLGNKTNAAQEYLKFIANQQAGGAPKPDAAVAPGGTAQAMNTAGPEKDPADPQAMALQNLLMQQDKAQKSAMAQNAQQQKISNMGSILGNLKQIQPAAVQAPVLPNGAGGEFSDMLRKRIYG